MQIIESKENINPSDPSVAFYTKTRHFISFTNQMNGFYMQCKTGLTVLNPISLQLTLSCTMLKNG